MTVPERRRILMMSSLQATNDLRVRVKVSVSVRVRVRVRISMMSSLQAMNDLSPNLP